VIGVIGVIVDRFSISPLFIYIYIFNDQNDRSIDK